MVYVALLRGINVGGKNKVDMKSLKALFELLGFDGVRTYINSSNVIFASSIISQKEIHEQIEAGITEHFGFHVPVVLRDLPSMEQTATALPDKWVNDQTMKC